jgi:uncharacterized membrane protein (DUF485 family)
MAGRNARIGLVLFVLYAACYAAFVFVSAFAPDWMDAKPFAGLNLAILSGFGLIVLALVLALIYGVMADRGPRDLANGREGASR